MSRFDLGWWRHERADTREAMTHTITGEMIEHVGPLAGDDLAAVRAAHADGQTLTWQRFNYQHPELRYPLAVGWNRDLGRIVVDHNLSAALVPGITSP